MCVAPERHTPALPAAHGWPIDCVRPEPMARRSNGRAACPGPGGGLAALIATEAQLRDDLAAARREAEAIIAEARRCAEAAEPAGPDAAERLVDAEVDADLAREVREIEESLARRLAAHQEALGPRLDELAGAVVEALLAGIRAAGSGGIP